MTGDVGVVGLPPDEAGLDDLYSDAPIGIRANMVMSADGAAAFGGATRAISSDTDLRLLLHLRRFADAVLVGAGTVRAENYGPVRLPEPIQRERLDAGYAAQPPIVVVTAGGALDPGSRLFTTGGARPIIATLRPVAEAGGPLADVADVVPVGDRAMDPAALLAALRERGLSRVLCEGGPTLLTSLIDADAVDDMCLSVSPYLAGSQPLRPASPSTLQSPSRLELRHARAHDGMVYLRYARAKM
jgi:riboflavin biosynthesis pyrimidine reductase